jgi:hypothetical protein
VYGTSIDKMTGNMFYMNCKSEISIYEHTHKADVMFIIFVEPHGLKDDYDWLNNVTLLMWLINTNKNERSADDKQVLHYCLIQHKDMHNIKQIWN